MLWSVPPVQTRAENDAVHFEIAGYTLTETPGEYWLPVQSSLIAVPTDAQPTLDVLSVQQSTRSLAYPAAVAPLPSGVVRDAQGTVIGGDFQPVVDANPQTPLLVKLEEAGVLRGVRLMRLTLSPIRPLGGDEAVVADLVEVRVQFNRPFVLTAVPDALPTAAPDSLRQTAQTMVVNPGQVAGFQSPTRSPFRQWSQLQAATTPTAVIEVTRTGITAVSYSDLNAAGFPLSSVNPQNLHLMRDGVEIPIEWDGNGDAAFEGHERFLFFASPRFSRWLNGDIYTLTADETPGQRIVSTTTATTGLANGQVWLETTAEVNGLYMPDCLCGSLPFGRDGDRWVWDFLLQDAGYNERKHAISPPMVDITVDAELTLWFVGYTSDVKSPHHQIDVAWNDSNLGTFGWDGKTAVTATMTIPSTVLQTANEITFYLRDEPDVLANGVWFDAARIRYGRSPVAAGDAVLFSGETTRHQYSVGLAETTDLRIYDVTDPDVPIELTGGTIAGNSVTFADLTDGLHTYAIANSSGVAAPDNVRLLRSLQTANTTGADYIIIAPESFMPALDSLIALRQSQGLQVVVEDVQAIYDTVGGGVPQPEAIHDYLANAYATWSPVPQYVVLVGDGSFDPKQYRDASTKTWIVPFFMEADPWIGEVPVDNRFVTFDGDGNGDFLPDMMIGRLPVNSLSETQVVVDKIVQYEINPEFGPWNSNITFVADNFRSNDPLNPFDNAGDFPNLSNSLIGGYVDSPWVPRKLYLDLELNPVDEVSIDLQNRWQEGTGLLFYTGHSSRYQWARERIFHVDDVSGLDNGARLPVVLEMTCLTGSFQIPDLVTLDEALLRHENGGAVAVWGSTGLGVATGHHELSSGFLQTVLVDENPVIGQATLAGKLNLKNFHRDLIDTFTLLGDPAMRLNTDIPEEAIFLPLLTK